VSDDGWEARMAERNREHQQAKTGREVATGKPDRPAPQPTWLNGWTRATASGEVLIGVEVHCVCCGRSRGITCVAFATDWQPPGPEPEWPFHPDDCPLCLALGWV